MAATKHKTRAIIGLSFIHILNGCEGSLCVLSAFVFHPGRMLALPLANDRPGNHILDEVSVRRFFIEENNSYEDHSIKMQVSVEDGTVDIRSV